MFLFPTCTQKILCSVYVLFSTYTQKILCSFYVLFSMVHTEDSVFNLCSLFHCARRYSGSVCSLFHLQNRSFCFQFTFSFPRCTQKILCSIYVLFSTVHADILVQFVLFSTYKTEVSVFSLCSLFHLHTEDSVFYLCSLFHCAHRSFCVQFTFSFPRCTQKFFTLSFLLLRNLQRCTFLPTKRKFCCDGPYCRHRRRLQNAAVLCD